MECNYITYSTWLAKKIMKNQSIYQRGEHSQKANICFEAIYLTNLVAQPTVYTSKII